MEIDTPLVMKQLGETDVGELLLVEYGGEWCLAVCLMKEEGSSDIRIGLLQGEQLDWPRIIITRTHHGCGSYGSDWYVELLPGQESVPYGAGQYREHYGTILVERSPGTATLTFGPDPEQRGHSGGSFTLPNFSLIRAVSGDGIPYTRWTIWQSREGYEEGEGKIATIEAKTPQPHPFGLMLGQDCS